MRRWVLVNNLRMQITSSLRDVNVHARLYRRAIVFGGGIRLLRGHLVAFACTCSPHETRGAREHDDEPAFPACTHYLAGGSCACCARSTRSVAQLSQNAAVSYDLMDGAAATWLLSFGDVRQCTRSGGAAKGTTGTAVFARSWRAN